MTVFFMQFLSDGSRCLWDEAGNARVMRADYSANDNHSNLTDDNSDAEED